MEEIYRARYVRGAWGIHTFSRFVPWYGHYREKAMAPHSILLPGKSYGRRSLVGCSPWGGEDERLHFHFSPSCIGEGNGSPLQCPCLENPRDRAAWWAAVYGVAQSRTRLKRLSSSSSSMVTTSKALWTPSFRGFMGVLLCRYERVSHWSLVIWLSLKAHSPA